MDTVPEFYTEASQATVRGGLPMRHPHPNILYPDIIKYFISCKLLSFQSSRIHCPIQSLTKKSSPFKRQQNLVA